MKLRLIHNSIAALGFGMLSIVLATSVAFAQSTSFTYQGRLTDGGTAANGNYDLQFALFDSLSGGTQVGSTQPLNTVAVSNGVFTLSLDFGANAFPGANRFLEISARPSGNGSFTTLSPRQQINSTPYAVRSLNATSADTVAVNGQTAFNITGLGNFTNSNTFAGVGAGAATTPNVNGLGADNSFFGNRAGQSNTTGGANSFFGESAGFSNTTGFNNSFFGQGAGFNNATGCCNSFFGGGAGVSTAGDQNSFFGYFAGANNISGNFNSFFGVGAGLHHSAGNLNTLIGHSTDVLPGSSTVIDNATAIGARARVDTSNSLVLGSINGINGATADTRVGIGTTAPTRLLHLKGPGSGGLGIGDLLVTGTGTVGAAITLQSTGANGRTFSWISTANDADSGGGKLAVFDATTGTGAYRMVIDSTGRVGIGTTGPDQTLSVNGNASKASGGAWLVFSDERLKNIKGRFTPGLAAVMRLQPLRYEYKRDNALTLKSEGEHIGFSAQAVQKIIPEAVTANDKGYLLVNNDPILWTMLNAIKEQQALIERQQEQIAGLKGLVCRTHRRVAVCK